MIRTQSVPSTKWEALPLLQVFLAALLLALAARVSIPLYFTPVPLTLQTLAVMFIGATLGSRKGALAVLLYLTEGALGLPVFAGGAAGIVHLFGMRTGYFLGYLLQAYIVGSFLERQLTFSFGRTMSLLLLSCALQMGLGVLGLSLFFGIKTAFAIGFLPFIAGETLKSLFVATTLRLRR